MVHEKMLSISNHQENANQNHSEILPSKWLLSKKKGYYQRENTKQMLVKIWWVKNPVHHLWNVDYFSHYIWSFLKNLKIEFTHVNKPNSEYISESEYLFFFLTGSVYWCRISFDCLMERLGHNSWVNFIWFCQNKSL